MIVLRFSLQGVDIFERTDGRCHVFTFLHASEDILEHTNSKCHLYKL